MPARSSSFYGWFSSKTSPPLRRLPFPCERSLRCCGPSVPRGCSSWPTASRRSAPASATSRSCSSPTSATPGRGASRSCCWPTSCRRSCWVRCSVRRPTGGRAAPARSSATWPGRSRSWASPSSAASRRRSPSRCWPGSAPGCTRPSILAGLPTLIDRERVPPAMSLYGQLTELGALIGPALAALLLLFTDATALLIVDGLTFAVSAALLAVLPFGRPERKESTSLCGRGARRPARHASDSGRHAGDPGQRRCAAVRGHAQRHRAAVRQERDRDGRVGLLRARGAQRPGHRAGERGRCARRRAARPQAAAAVRHRHDRHGSDRACRRRPTSARPASRSWRWASATGWCWCTAACCSSGSCPSTYWAASTA